MKSTILNKKYASYPNYNSYMRSLDYITFEMLIKITTIYSFVLPLNRSLFTHAKKPFSFILCVIRKKSVF